MQSVCVCVGVGGCLFLSLSEMELNSLKLQHCKNIEMIYADKKSELLV